MENALVNMVSPRVTYCLPEHSGNEMPCRTEGNRIPRLKLCVHSRMKTSREQKRTCLECHAKENPGVPSEFENLFLFLLENGT